MSQLQKRERRGEFVPPVATLRVIQGLGVTEAADALGISTTRLHNARKKGAVARVVEIAAEGLLNTPKPEKTAPVHLVKSAAAPQEPVLMLLEVPPDKARMVERLCKALGAKFVEA